MVEQLTIVCALPLYHIFALTACAMWGTRVGALNILIPNPRDIGGFIKELQKYKFNMLPAVNTLYNALLNHPEFDKIDFSGAEDLSNGGGMAVQQAVNDKWKKATGTSHHRRLRPVRNLAGRHLQPRRHDRIHRHHRPADAVDRHRHPRRRRQAGGAGRARARSRSAARR